MQLCQPSDRPSALHFLLLIDSWIYVFVAYRCPQAKAEARQVTSNLVNVAQSRLEEAVGGFRHRKRQELAKLSRVFDRNLRSKVSD